MRGNGENMETVQPPPGGRVAEIAVPGAVTGPTGRGKEEACAVQIVPPQPKLDISTLVPIRRSPAFHSLQYIRLSPSWLVVVTFEPMLPTGPEDVVPFSTCFFRTR